MTLRRIQLVLSFALGAVVSQQTFHLYEGFAHRADWLYWDPAAHAWYGIRIAQTLRHFELLEFLKAINEQTLWPPLHSLLQTPFHLIMEPGGYAASLCSFVFLALIFPALTFLYHRFSDAWSGWAVLMAFTASSPYYAGFGSMPMLEIFGAAFSAVSAALYLGKSRWFPLSLMLLFFLKYNYCLYVLMPVLVIEWWPALAAGFKSAITPPRRIPTMSPFAWFVAVCLLLMGAILVTGGFKIGKLSVRGISNPLYVLFLIVLFRGAILGQHRDIWRKIRGTGWEWFVVPVVIWLVIPVPNRIRTLVNFAVNAPLGGHQPTELSYYTFYVDALSVYFSAWWLKWMCVAAAIISAVACRRKREVVFIVLLFALPFLLMTLNQNKQERFLFTFVFALWILCAEGMSRIPGAVLRGALSIGLCAACLYYYNISNVQDQVAWPFVPLEVEAPADYIAEQAAGAQEVRVLGTTNEMSPALLQSRIFHITGSTWSPHLAWKVERNPPANTRIIAINQDAPGAAVTSRMFPGGYRIIVSAWSKTSQ